MKTLLFHVFISSKPLIAIYMPERKTRNNRGLGSYQKIVSEQNCYE